MKYPIPLLIISALLAAFAASSYFGAAPTTPTKEGIPASASTLSEDEMASSGDALGAQKYVPIIGLDSSSDIASRPYYPYYHKFDAMTYVDRRIEMPRVGVKLDDANLGQLQKATFRIDLGYENVPTKIQAVWTVANAEQTDFRAASYADFDLTPEQEEEAIGSTVIVTTNAMTGLPHANHSKRVASFKIPSNLPKTDGLEGALHFTVTGTYASRSNSSISGFRKWKFEETFEIGWRIVEDEYLVFTPNIKNTGGGSDQSGNRHPGKDFVALPNGHFYFIDSPEIFGPFSRVLRPESAGQTHQTENDDNYNVPHDIAYEYTGWGFYDERKSGWMIVAPAAAEGEVHDDMPGRLIGPFESIDSAGVTSIGNNRVWFIYKDGDRWSSYDNGESSLAE